MKIKLRRRDATTLIELIIVLVMMGLFIMMVFNMFSVTFDAYTFNREMSAKLYAQTNVDNFFEMFERELMYAGSMGGVIKKLDDDVFDPNNSINIEQSTITLQYGLAEQLILTKKDKTNYDKINPQPVSSYDLTYFPLYKASVPDNLANRWALVYDDINNVDISSATVLEINSIAKTDVEVTTSEGNKSATLFEIDPADVSITDPATYISILLNEKAFDSLDTKEILLQTGDTKKWRGEMVYK